MIDSLPGKGLGLERTGGDRQDVLIAQGGGRAHAGSQGGPGARLPRVLALSAQGRLEVARASRSTQVLGRQRRRIETTIW